MYNKKRVSNNQDFAKFVEYQTEQGKTPVEICAMLETFGCHCAPVSVELYLLDQLPNVPRIKKAVQ